MSTAKELFIKAQNEQLTTVAGYRVSALKGLDELRSFNGEDDYQISLAAIVKEYLKGIVVTKVREVLPDSVILDKAISELVKKQVITSEPYGKRSQLLKPVLPPPTQPPQPPTPPVRQGVVSVDTNPTNNPAWNAGTPAPTTPVVDVIDVAEVVQG